MVVSGGACLDASAVVLDSMAGLFMGSRTFGGVVVDSTGIQCYPQRRIGVCYQSCALADVGAVGAALAGFVYGNGGVAVSASSSAGVAGICRGRGVGVRIPAPRGKYGFAGWVTFGIGGVSCIVAEAISGNLVAKMVDAVSLWVGRFGGVCSLDGAQCGVVESRSLSVSSISYSLVLLVPN